MSHTVKYIPPKEPEQEIKLKPKKPKGRRKSNKKQLLDLDYYNI